MVGTLTSEESAHFPPQPPRAHMSSSASSGWLSSVGPPRPSLPFSAVLGVAWLDTSVGPLSSSFSWVWRMERGESSQGTRVVRVFVLLLLPEGSPWTSSSFNQRSGGPVRSPLFLQVLHLFHALTCQAWRWSRAPLSESWGNSTIPWASCTPPIAL